MKKKILLGALEELEEEIVPAEEDEGDNEPYEGDLDEKLLAVMEAEDDIDESADAVMEIEKGLDEADASVERLESLVELIKTYGLSATMMKAADPQRELVAAGICPAYEELEEGEGEEAEEKKKEATDAAAEGIGDAIKAYFTGQIEFFVKYVKNYIEYYVNIGRALESYASALSSMDKKLRGITGFDEAKFGERNVKVYSHPDFIKAIAAANAVLKLTNGGFLTKTIADFEKFISENETKIEDVDKTIDGLFGELNRVQESNSVAEVLGITFVKNDSNIISIKTSKSKMSITSDSTKNLGWKAADAAKSCKMALAVVNTADVLRTKLKGISDILKKYSATLKSQSAKTGAMNPEQAAAIKYAINHSKNIINVQRQLIRATEVATRNVCKTALSVGSAAAKSGKK